VPGTDTQDFGNPLRLRRALDAGVRIVVAHCASMGQDRDLDKGPNGPLVESFSLFERLMQEKAYETNLFGDLSAMTQVTRAGPALAKVIEREDWHPRLLNGSDYPLPGVMPIFSVDYLVSLGLVQESAAPPLRRTCRNAAKRDPCPSRRAATSPPARRRASPAPAPPRNRRGRDGSTRPTRSSADARAPARARSRRGHESW